MLPEFMESPSPSLLKRSVCEGKSSINRHYSALVSMKEAMFGRQRRLDKFGKQLARSGEQWTRPSSRISFYP
jgi:hypothetical protein